MSEYKRLLKTFDYHDIDQVEEMIKKHAKKSNEYNSTFRLLNLLKERLPVRCQGLILRGNKVLFLKCYGKRLKDIYYTLPGGSITRGEDLVSAIVREVQEEVGIEVDIIHRLPRHQDWDRDDFYIDYESFICKAKENISREHDAKEEGSDIIDHLWISIDDFEKYAQDQSMHFHVFPSMIELKIQLEKHKKK